MRLQQKEYPVSAGQIRTIKMACRQLGISRELEHDMIAERYNGKSSCTDLTFRQAGHFIQELESKGFVLVQKGKPKKQQLPRPRRAPVDHGLNTARPVARSGSKVVCLVRPEEIDKINKIAALITWRVEGGLQLFLEKRMKIKDGQVKTSAQAYLAIEGLKKMFENGMKKAHGRNWWIMQHDHPGIMEYIAIHLPAEYR